MAIYEYCHDKEKYTLIASNGRKFHKLISEHVKLKIGDLGDTVKLLKKENGKNLYIQHLQSESKSDFSKRIRNYDFYEEVGDFLLENEQSSVINFSDLQVTVSNVGEKQGYEDVPIYYSISYPAKSPLFLVGQGIDDLSNYDIDYDNDKGITRYVLKGRAEEYDYIPNKRELNETDLKNCSEVYALKCKKGNYCDKRPIYVSAGTLDKAKLVKKIKRNLIEYKSLENSYEEVKTKLKSILDGDQKIAIAIIPSSKVDNPTILDFIVENFAKEHSKKIIASENFLSRTHSKSESHLTNERSIEKNLNTLKVENIDLSGVKAIVVLDDVTTSGGSFVAVNELLKKHYPGIPLINLAYAKTLHNNSKKWKKIKQDVFYL